ncbi:MAG: glycosyltransferase family 4 protein [Candidatus Zixiibacteriota bacterium]
MRIRFVTLYFPPEVGAAQRRISELARRLAGLGHEVTIVTGFPNYPSGIKPEGYRGRFIMKEKTDNFAIIRLPHYVAPNKGFFKRILIHLTFAFSACMYCVFMKRDDVAYVESPPLFNGFVGLAMKWLRRIPYVFNVADLWPQTAIELGALKNRQLIAFTQFLERLFYNKSARILAVTAGIQEFVVNMGYDKSKVPLITNGVDHTIFNLDVKPSPDILKYKNDSRILALYAGTHGMAHALGVILQAAKRLENEPIDFLFIGDGAEKDDLLQQSKDLALANVTFLEPLPQSEMPAVLRAADMAIIPLKDLPLFDSAMPSKCFEALAAGLPIMLSVRGEMARHVNKASCGFTAEPENLDQIVQGFKNFISLSPDERKQMSKRGREYVVAHFSREAITKRLETELQEILNHG